MFRPDPESFADLVKSGAQDAVDDTLGDQIGSYNVLGNMNAAVDLFDGQTVTSQGNVDTADVEEAKPPQSAVETLLFQF